MSRENLYDSRQPLECCDLPHLCRSLGVVVFGPFPYHGLPDKPAYGDVNYETISINTNTYGSSRPVAELDDYIVLTTTKIITDLDRVIDELQQHRIRLTNELENIAADPPITTQLSNQPTIQPPNQLSLKMS